MPEDSRSSLHRGVRPLVRLGGSIVHGEPVFCLSCGKQDGWVTADLPPGVVYVCDACSALHGEPEGFTPRPDLDLARTD